MKDNINKSIKVSMTAIDITFFAFTILTFIFKEKISTLVLSINAAFFVVLTFFTIMTLGFPPNKKNKAKIRTTNHILIISTLYLITIYLAGNATGFIKNELSFLKTLYLIIYYLAAELFRYSYFKKCNKNGIHQYINTFTFILLDILVLSSFSPVNFLNISTFLTIILISIMKNCILSYTTNKFGYTPCYVYSFFMTIMPSLLPFYPALGNYLNLVFNIICTSVVLYNITKPIRRSDEESINKYQKSISFYLERALLVVVLIAILLVSGVFHYSLTAIASDSMYPYLKKGDAIILEKVTSKNRDTLKKGDIVAYEEDGKIVTHRILEIEMENGEEKIITKGDNNDIKDVTKKAKDDIIGIVRFRIPLLGYPSVEISEIRKNK